jgi:hypothetical protein
MGNLSDTERPAQPRPLCETMPNAVRAAIHNGNTLSDIRLDRWADTYRCGTESIRLEWDRQLSIKSQLPDNSFDVEGK